jgi:hypothetical protein
MKISDILINEAPAVAPAPAAAPAPEPAVNPYTGLSTAAKPVTTGTGGTTNITTRSDDELAWAQKQGPFPTGQYPGPGKWDPKTGRTKRESIEYHESDNQLLQRMRQIAGLK